MTRLNHGCGALLLGAVAFLTACPPEGEGEGEGQGADAGILLSGDPKIEILDPVEGQTIAAATPEPAVGGNAVRAPYSVRARLVGAGTEVVQQLIVLAGEGAVPLNHPVDLVDEADGRVATVLVQVGGLWTINQGSSPVVIEVDPDENWTGPDLRTAITVLVQPKAGGPGDECRFAFDGFCDEPDLCAAGSDTTDCG